MDKETGLMIADETTHIRQSIVDILTTAKGSRLMRRDYGSDLFRLIDKPMNGALMLQIAAASVMALKNWEPRISVNRFKVVANPAQPSQLTADIDIVFNHQNRKKEMQFTDLQLR